MTLVPGRAFFASALAVYSLAVFPAAAQSVISTHSGLIHYFEGNVYLADQSLEPHVGRFPSVPQGSELRTVEGRAEVLLTPGVFLRMGDRTTIRMVSTELADTQVELEAGSVVIDSGEPNLNTSVTLTFKDWKVRIPQKGVCRIDSDPPRLLVRTGRAEVIGNAGATPVSVDAGMNLPFAKVLVPEPWKDSPTQTSTDGDLTAGLKSSKDPLNEWNRGRSESIIADNAITAQLDQDPGAQGSGGLGMDGFTNFPLLGVSPIYDPSMGVGSYSGLTSSGIYNTYNPVQPGFNSIYLPGYTYRPFIVGLMGPGISGTGIVGIGIRPSVGIGIAPGSIYPRPIMLPHTGVGPSPYTGAPAPGYVPGRVPLSHPASPVHAPAPVHIAPHR